jgi:hypothetical protein
MRRQEMIISINLSIFLLLEMIHHKITDVTHSNRKIMNKKLFVESAPYETTLNLSRIRIIMVKREYIPNNQL